MRRLAVHRICSHHALDRKTAVSGVTGECAAIGQNAFLRIRDKLCGGTLERLVEFACSHGASRSRCPGFAGEAPSYIHLIFTTSGQFVITVIGGPSSVVVMLIRNRCPSGATS